MRYFVLLFLLGCVSFTAIGCEASAKTDTDHDHEAKVKVDTH